MTTFTGTAGNDNQNGSNNADTFNYAQGGNDTLSGKSGNDIFNMGAVLNAADAIDGGNGTDTVNISGDYTGANALVMNATTITTVETLAMAAGFNYAITTNDGNVASNQTLTVDASLLGASNILTFNGSAETNGRFSVIAGAGNDVLTVGAGADVLDLSHGGNDTAYGGAGNDTFRFGATYNASDFVNGGTGNDTVNLAGDYSDGFTLAAGMMASVETIQLTAGNTYALTLDNSFLTIGHNLTVDGSALGAGNQLLFDGTAETTSALTVMGGAGTDIIYTGGGNDRIVFTTGFDAGDTIDGGAGYNTLELNGDYSGGLTFAPTTIQNIDRIVVDAGHSYKLTLDNANLATGDKLVVDASALAGGSTLNFDISDVTGATYRVTGGAGNDTITVGDGFGSLDRIDGGAGTDTLVLNGDFSGGLALTGRMANHLETLRVAAGNNYDLTTNDAVVALGQTFTIDGSGLGAGDTLTFSGVHERDGAFALIGGAGDDVLTGSSGNDTFDLSHGGDDTAYGGKGDDVFNMGGVFAVGGDNIDGGAGDNTLALNGDYSALLTLDNGTLTNIDRMTFAAGHDYNLLLNDTDAFTIDASAMGAGDSFAFNGAGPENVIGHVGADMIVASGTIDVSQGGNDTVIISAGTVNFGAALTAADGVSGTESVTVSLDGDYSAGLSLANVSAGDFELAAGHSYNLTLNQASVAFVGGGTGVDGSALGASDSLSFDGSSVLTGQLDLSGGAGNDTLIGGAGGGFLDGGGGHDVLTGGSGGAGFAYDSVADSTGTNFDTITNFDATNDAITFFFTAPVNAIDAAVNGGHLDSGANFNTQLAGLIGSGQLAAHNAVLFTPNAGTLSGHLLLIVDANGTGGYQAGQDMVIDVTGMTGTLATTDFVVF